MPFCGMSCQKYYNCNSNGRKKLALTPRKPSYRQRGNDIKNL